MLELCYSGQVGGFHAMQGPLYQCYEITSQHCDSPYQPILELQKTHSDQLGNKIGSRESFYLYLVEI